MKKFILSVAAIVIACSIANAQGVDTTAQYQQQLQIQQQELQQQQAEAEAAAKAAAKEQARIEKEQKAAERQYRKEARREEYGRGLSLNVDLFEGVSVPVKASYSDDWLAVLQGDFGAAVSFNYPIFKHTDFTFGVGYLFKGLQFDNHLVCDSATQLLTLQTVTDSLYHRSFINAGYIIVPMRLTLYNSDNRPAHYIGLNVGYSIHNVFFNQKMTNGDREAVDYWNNTKMMNPWRMELVLGSIEKRILCFNLGLQIYYNLTPTFVKGTDAHRFHEFGARINL